jgi:cytochrome c556
VKKLPFLIGAVVALAMPALSAEDPIAVRKALMQSNGAAAGVSGGIMKGELDYSPAVGKSAIAAFNAVGAAIGDFFPEGTVDDERTTAAPKIWEDPAGFEAALAKFQETSAAAFEAAGKDGPADADAFKAAVGRVMETCKTCHDNYRVKKE